MKKYFALLISISLIFISCSKYQRVLKGTDMEKKYEYAEKYFLKKDYYHALQLLEELISVYRGTSKGEQTYFYYAYSNYYTGDYAMAAYHFNNFVQTYPNSSFAEEMQYMHAYCYYLDSPIYSLDQSNTYDAIDKFQLFINKFPTSSRVAEANRLIDEMRFKIETKEFQKAKIYYRTENYKSAIVGFDNVIKDYPGTSFQEEALYLSLRSYYLYAEKSIETKKAERYKLTLESYLKLIDTFPQTKYLKEAEKIYTNAQVSLKRQIEKDVLTVNH